MKRNTMSFKAIINNMAKENNVAAQSVLQINDTKVIYFKKYYTNMK